MPTARSISSSFVARPAPNSIAATPISSATISEEFLSNQGGDASVVDDPSKLPQAAYKIDVPAKEACLSFFRQYDHLAAEREDQFV
jgi:hypothetical protein